MQEQIRWKWTDHPSLRRSCCARNDATVLHPLRRLQPTFDVEQHPWTIRMLSNRLEQQLPIDAVKIAPDINVEHPIVAPAPLTRRAHGIDCRSTGPIPIGIGVEYRLQTWLQEMTSDFLGDAIRYRRNNLPKAPGSWDLELLKASVVILDFPSIQKETLCVRIRTRRLPTITNRLQKLIGQRRNSTAVTTT